MRWCYGILLLIMCSSVLAQNTRFRAHNEAGDLIFRVQDQGEMLFRDPVNDGNPAFTIGASLAEQLGISTIFDPGTQSLDYVMFQSDTASATADKGRFLFNVDGANTKFTIDDGGVTVGATESLTLSQELADRILYTTTGGQVTTDANLLWDSGNAVLNISNNKFRVDGSTQRVSINGFTNAAGALTINETGNSQGYLAFAGTIASGTSELDAITLAATYDPTGAITTIRGIDMDVSISSFDSPAVTNLEGIDIQLGFGVSFYAGAITDAKGVVIKSVVNNGLGAPTVTTQTGIEVKDLTYAANNRAIDLQVASATDAYNLYVQGTAVNYLEGNTVFGAATPVSSSKLSVDGDADQIQLLIQGNATQTSDLVVFENSAGTDLLTFSNAGALTFIDNVRQTFNPGATVAGLNVGSEAADPSTPINGDIFYNSTSNALRARINGAWVSLGAGGGSSEWTLNGSDLHPNTAATTNVIVGGTTQATGDIVANATGQLIVNEQGASLNPVMRVEGTGLENLFRLNGTDNRVVIGKSSGDQRLNVSSEGTQFPLVLEQYGGTSPSCIFFLRGARGTLASPTAIQSGDIVGQWSIEGYGATGFGGTSLMRFQALAEANFTDASKPTAFVIHTTPSGSTSGTERLRITGSGSVGIGTNNPAALLQVANGNNTQDIRISGKTGNTVHGILGYVVGTGTYLQLHDNTPTSNVLFRSYGDSYTRNNFAVGLTTPAAKLEVNAAAAGDVVAIFQGTTSQTGDLIQAQNSAGTTKIRIEPSGAMLMHDRGSNPTPGTDEAGIFVKDVAGTTEVFAIDEGATATPLSPHAMDAPDSFYEDVTQKGIERITTLYIPWKGTVIEGQSYDGAVIFEHVLRPKTSLKPLRVIESYAQYVTRMGYTQEEAQARGLIARDRAVVNAEREAKWQQEKTEYVAAVQAWAAKPWFARSDKPERIRERPKPIPNVIQ